jgi:hypothetical protein
MNNVCDCGGRMRVHKFVDICVDCGYCGTDEIGSYIESITALSRELDVYKNRVANNDTKFCDFGILYEKLENKLEDKSKRLQKRVKDIETLNGLLKDIDSVLSLGANPKWDDNRRILEAAYILAKWKGGG